MAGAQFVTRILSPGAKKPPVPQGAGGFFMAAPVSTGHLDFSRSPIALPIPYQDVEKVLPWTFSTPEPGNHFSAPRGKKKNPDRYARPGFVARVSAEPQGDLYIMPPMPPMPPPMSGMAGAASSFGSSATMHSVVIIRLATEAAFCRALRVTLVGSRIPISTMSP